MKKFIAGILVGVLLAVGITTFAAAEFDNTKVIQVLDKVFVGQNATAELNMHDDVVGEDLPTFSYKQRTYLPLRKIAEALNADSGLMWNPYTKSVHIIANSYNKDVVANAIKNKTIMYVIYTDGLNMAVQMPDGHRYYAERLDGSPAENQTNFLVQNAYSYNSDGQECYTVFNASHSAKFLLKLLD
jgi:hypothetical protein